MKGARCKQLHLHASVYKKCPEKAHLRRQRTDQLLFWAGLGAGIHCKQTQEAFGDGGNVLKLDLWGWLYNSIQK